jgi:hypothetical protein
MQAGSGVAQIKVDVQRFDDAGPAAAFQGEFA